MSAFATSFLSTFLGAALGAWFAIWCDGRRTRRLMYARLLDLNRRVTALEVDAAARRAQNAAAALLKKLDA
jgi:hypothetical protein